MGQGSFESRVGLVNLGYYGLSIFFQQIQVGLNSVNLIVLEI